ncbi:MAG: DUF2029 domain-containing protein, partial [Alphaproteobacteria bacterium]|nr:DUF2029 domain-containing protein [Alphaproteobacteria bacterium]
GPAIAFFAVYGLRRGFAPYEITALSALWLVPLIARSVAKTTLLPLGAIVMLALFVVVMRRARADLAAEAHPTAMSVPAE